MRRILRATGWTFIGTGGFVLYFLVYQLVGTSVVAGKDQADLRRNLEQQWSTGSGAQVAAAQRRSAPTPRVAKGQGFALMRIPKIKVERVLVEGVDREDLRKGPGHVPSTVLPGQPGTFGVSGHRTTYGAPFYRLDELSKGDEIFVETRAAVFVYAVTSTKIVLPTDVWVLDDIPGPGGRPKSTITLTTCTPRYSARQRLIVFGDLVSTRPNVRAAAA